MGRPKGSKQTAEAKAKIGAASRGRVFSAETRARMGAAKKGNQYNLGKKRSPETRERMRLAQRARPKNPEATYIARHKRVWRARSKAALRNCVDCGKQARDWSLRHGADPLDVMNYDPRCRNCHWVYDGARMPTGSGRRLGGKNKHPLSAEARANISAGHRGLKYRKRSS